MKISLHSFCKDRGLPKSTVHRRCQEMGIDTSDGLTQDDCDRLLEEFGVKPDPVPDLPEVEQGVSAIVPLVKRVEIQPQPEELVARRITPTIVHYDVTELSEATKLNREAATHNIDALGVQLKHQLRELARLHVAEAKQEYAKTIAEELGK